MQHLFDADIAAEYGINAAIILQHIAFWVAKNEANEVNCYDGVYWTYNSIKAFHIIFPYMTEKQIRNALAKLIDENLIISGNYNTSSYDRTKWYALTEKGKSILPKRQIDFAEKEKQNSQKGEPIPDIIPDINTDINTDIEDINISSLSTVPVDVEKFTPRQIVNLYHEICKSLPQTRTLSQNRSKAIKARLRTYGIKEIQEVFKKAEASDFLKGKNDRNWTANFDWLMIDGNFAKVLDGKYDNKKVSQPAFDPWAKAREEGF